MQTKIYHLEALAFHRELLDARDLKIFLSTLHLHDEMFAKYFANVLLVHVIC